MAFPQTFENSYYLLDVSPVSGTWSVSIFSWSVTCLFVLLAGSFAEIFFFLILIKSSFALFFSFIESRLRRRHHVLGRKDLGFLLCCLLDVSHLTLWFILSSVLYEV